MVVFTIFTLIVLATQVSGQGRIGQYSANSWVIWMSIKDSDVINPPLVSFMCQGMSYLMMRIVEYKLHVNIKPKKEMIHG